MPHNSSLTYSDFDVKIETQNLLIRPFRSSDVHDVYEYMSDAATTYYLPEGTLSQADVVSFIADNPKAFAITLRENGKLVGHVEFYNWHNGHTYEIGWAVNSRFRRKGIAFEAASAALDYGFVTLGVHRVIATSQPENVASYGLMDKLGMVREGHFRQCIPKGNDVWWDEYFYTMLFSDYEKMQA